MSTTTGTTTGTTNRKATTMPETPVHLRPTSCYVCGTAAAPATGRPSCAHDWTNAEAKAEAAEHDRRVVLAETPEARYVRQHRPY